MWSQAPGVRRALRRSRKRGRLGKMDMLVVMSDGCEQFSHVMVIQAIKGVTPGAAHPDEPCLTEQSKLM